jgi:hypothetical protein
MAQDRIPIAELKNYLNKEVHQFDKIVKV